MPNEDDPTGIWYNSADNRYLAQPVEQQSDNNRGIIFYTKANASNQPNLFNRLYSEDVWSLAGPENDIDGWQQSTINWNCDPFIGNSVVAYTAQEHRLLQLYVSLLFNFIF